MKDRLAMVVGFGFTVVAVGFLWVSLALQNLRKKNQKQEDDIADIQEDMDILYVESFLDDDGEMTENKTTLH